MARRNTRSSPRTRNSKAGVALKDKDQDTASEIINKLSQKYKKTSDVDAPHTKKRKASEKASDAPRVKRSSGRIAKLKESDSYQADVESNTDSSQGDGASIDLYDFENSEENLRLHFTPDKPAAKRRASSGRAEASKKPRTLKTSQTQNKDKKAPAPKGSAGFARPGHLQKLLCSDNKRSQLKDSPRDKAYDSGVFMTPSPVNSSAAVVHLSCPRGKVATTSTPASAAPVKAAAKATKRAPPPEYGDALAAPPDVSPVKRLVSPHSGGIHGGLVASPLELDLSTAKLPPSVNCSPALKPKETPMEAPKEAPWVTPKDTTKEAPKEVLAVGEEDGSYKPLDVSKTYDSFSEKPKLKKKIKTKKESRYSVSRYEVWADKKASEFDEIEQFELSIE